MQHKKATIPMNAFLKASSTYYTNYLSKSYFLSYNSKLYRNKLKTSRSPLDQGSNPSCTGIKIKRAAEKKEETDINFQEFCFVFRVFRSKQRKPQTVTPFLYCLNTKVVQSHLQHSICQLWGKKKGKQLSMLLIMASSGRFKHHMIHDRWRKI